MDAEARHCGAHRNENTDGYLSDAATWYNVWLDTRRYTMDTNRWTGVSILLGKRFQPRMIKEISVPPSSWREGEEHD